MHVVRGDIFWVKKNPFRPAVGSVMEADRPAIIVSNNTGNKNATIYECVFLTTAPKSDLPTHVTIRSAPETSTALCEQITSIGEEQLGRYIGKCSTAEMIAIDQALLISLGIDIINLDQKVIVEPAEPQESKTPNPSDVAMMVEAGKIVKELEVYKELYNNLLAHMLTKV